MAGTAESPASRRAIEFFFDVGSPAAYLAWTQVEKLEAVAPVRLRPMLLGGVFAATGNASPITTPAKRAWVMTDFSRWAKRYHVPLRLPPGFPLNTLSLMRGAAALEGTPQLIPYLRAVFEALFARGQDLSDPDILAGVLTDAGFDAPALLEQTKIPEIKKRLRATTDEATARGVFGAPTFFVGADMYFGNDRLGWVIEAASQAEQ